MVFIAVLAAGMVLSLGPATSVHAATISVNSVADVVADDGQCTLREAINAANTDTASGGTSGECVAGSGDDIITLPEGEYGQGVNGTMQISSNLTINGAGAANTVIYGNDVDQVLNISSDSDPITVGINNITIIGNRVYDDSGGGIYNSGTLTLTNVIISHTVALEGGGIYNSGTLTLTNCTLSNNTARDNGGGIYNSGTLELTDSTVSENSAGLFSGGGIYNSGTVTLTNSTVSYNRALYSGGGIYNYDSGTLTLTNSTVSNNITADFEGGGGGIYNSGTLTLADSTVSDNSAASSSSGGGIYNSGTVTLTNSTVSYNTADFDGGGIYNPRSGTLTLTNSTVSGNSANGFSGGGIYNHGFLILQKSTVSNNTVVQSGGGIYNSRSGTLTLTNSTVSDNAAEEGGGIHNSGILELTDSTVSGNSANTSSGGGIYNFDDNYDSDTLTLTNSTVSNNTAVQSGGGIYTYLGILELTNSTVSGNSANTSSGGGIYSNYGTLTLTNSTVSGNSANTSSGGGIYNSGFLILQKSTVSDNSADSGGGIFDYNPSDVYGSIIAQNTANTAPDCFDTIGPMSHGYNLVGDGTGCSGFGMPGDQVGTGVSPINPLLGPLGDNGGPTFTHALLMGSPAIDAGTCGYYPGTDQRGVARPQGAGCDIGAYEVVISIIDLGLLGENASLNESRAFGISTSGQVAGYSTTSSAGVGRAFLIIPEDSDANGTPDTWYRDVGGKNDLMIDLGTLGGTHSVASDLNNSGQVAGYSNTASGESHAFLWEDVDGNGQSDPGEMIDLGTLPGGDSSTAYDINDSGQVVGESDIGGSPGNHGFLITPEDTDTNGTPDLWYRDNNSDGVNDLMIDLGTLDGISSVARGINNLGQVVGRSSTPSGDLHAFLITPEDTDTNGTPDRWYRDNNSDGVNDLMIDLGLLTSLNYSLGTAINDLSQVVGWGRPSGASDLYPFLWSAGSGMTIGSFGGYFSAAWGINELGQVVGRSETASGEERAFVWTEGAGIIDLGTLPGGAESGASGIQENGKGIVGFSLDSMGERHAVLWRSDSNTYAGTNVEVVSGNTTITFPTVTTPGFTTVEESASNPVVGVELPDGTPVGPFYNIQTTATFSGTVTIALSYDDTGIADESVLQIYHMEGGSWVDCTDRVDTFNNIIYGEVSSFSWFALVGPFLEVAIDIKPGSDPNCFNSDGKGVIPVAILGSADFDAGTVDPFSVSLDGAAVRVKGKSGNAGSLEDVNSDGFQDLVVQITDESGFTSGDSSATLTGETFDGTPIEGSDSICIVP
jgi:CSLREA domain-containing protein